MKTNELLYKKFLRALQEDMEQETPYLVSAMVSAIVANNDYVVLDEEFAARKFKKILVLSSNLYFFNAWRGNPKIQLMANHADEKTTSIEEESFSKDLIKVLTKDGTRGLKLFYDEHYTRVDFYFTVQDVVKLYSHYMGVNASEDDVRWLKGYQFQLWEPFDFCI